MKLILILLLFVSLFCNAQNLSNDETLMPKLGIKMSDDINELRSTRLKSVPMLRKFDLKGCALNKNSISLFDKNQHKDTDEVLSPLFGFRMSTDRSEIRRFHFISLTMFTLGMTVNTHDILTNNPEYFFARFPNAPMSFWYLHESWHNKYKNGNPEEGKAFPLSTTVLVGFTDGWHLTNMIAHFQVATVISLSVFSKDYRNIKLGQAICRIAYFSACYYAGYNFMDRVVYKHY